MAMYLFKRAADGIWIFGDTKNDECPSGVFRLNANANGSSISIISVFVSDYKPVKYKASTFFLKEDDSAYASFAAFVAGAAGFFQNGESNALTDTELRVSEVAVIDKKLSGSWGDKVNPAGVAKYEAPAGYYFYGCTCRIANTVIASLEKNVANVVSADDTDSYIGVAMYVGEYHPFVNKIVSVTLTNTVDQLQYWLKPL